MSKSFLLLALCGLTACAARGMNDDPADLAAQETATDAGGDGKFGAACTVDADCAASGTTCLKEVALPFGAPMTFPGGFCTKACKADAECGSDGACPLAAVEAFLPGISQCLKPCATVSDCREGYRCAAASLGRVPGLGGPASTQAPVTFCLPPSQNEPDASVRPAI